MRKIINTEYPPKQARFIPIYTLSTCNLRYARNILTNYLLIDCNIPNGSVKNIYS